MDRRRLIRVLGHELNNSLAPIKSTAETLAHLLDREPRPEDWDEDARSALRMISQRSEALSRFRKEMLENSTQVKVNPELVKKLLALFVGKM